MERFGTTRTPEVAERTLRACLLLAGVHDDKKLAPLAELAVGTQGQEQPTPWAYLARGLAEYRVGRFAQAAVWLEERPTDKPNPVPKASRGFVLAMAQHRRGQVEAARVTLPRAREMTAKLPVRSQARNWGVLIYNDLLGREAEASLPGRRQGRRSNERQKRNAREWKRSCQSAHYRGAM